MLIAKNKVVSLQYELYDDANELIDKPEAPLSYLHGGYDGIFPLVEEALEGKATIGYEGIDYEISAGECFRFEKNGLHSVTANGRFKMALLLVLE